MALKITPEREPLVEEIQLRCALVAVNEARRCFDEKSAPRRARRRRRRGPQDRVPCLPRWPVPLRGRSSEISRRTRSARSPFRRALRADALPVEVARKAGVLRLSERLHATTMSRRMNAESRPYQQWLPQEQVGLPVPLLSNVIPDHFRPIVPDAHAGKTENDPLMVLLVTV